MEVISACACAFPDPVHDEADAALSHLIIRQRAILERADCIIGGDFPDVIVVVNLIHVHTLMKGIYIQSM